MSSLSKPYYNHSPHTINPQLDTPVERSMEPQIGHNNNNNHKGHYHHKSNSVNFNDFSVDHSVINHDDDDDNDDNASFKVLKTSIQNPYDTAKKRQSQLSAVSPRRLGTPNSPRSDNSLSPQMNNHLVSNFETNNDTTNVGKINNDNVKRFNTTIQHKRQSQNSLAMNIPEYKVIQEQKKTDYLIKLVVVGDGGCGKTCLLISYSRGEFPTTYVPTIFENYISIVKTPTNKYIELSLWDTAGQEEYDRLRPLSYPDVNVIMVCYSINNPISLSNVKNQWAPEVKHFCPGIPIILIGTKSDMVNSTDKKNELNIVDFEDANLIAAEIGADYHVRCSAKTTENINHAFNIAITIGLNKVMADQKEKEEVAKIKKKKSRLSKRFSWHLNDHDNSSKVVEEYYYQNTGLARTKPKIKKHRCVIL